MKRWIGRVPPGGEFVVTSWSVAIGGARIDHDCFAYPVYSPLSVVVIDIEEEVTQVFAHGTREGKGYWLALNQCS